MRHTNLIVDGLHAHADARRAVHRTLRAEEGVIRVFVNPPIDTVYVAYDPWITGPETLVAALRRAGFAARDPLGGAAPTAAVRVPQRTQRSAQNTEPARP